jgi:hypothetical protein
MWASHFQTAASHSLHGRSRQAPFVIRSFYPICLQHSALLHNTRRPTSRQMDPQCNRNYKHPGTADHWSKICTCPLHVGEGGHRLFICVALRHYRCKKEDTCCQVQHQQVVVYERNMVLRLHLLVWLIDKRRQFYRMRISDPLTAVIFIFFYYSLTFLSHLRSALKAQLNCHLRLLTNKADDVDTRYTERKLIEANWRKVTTRTLLTIVMAVTYNQYPWTLFSSLWCHFENNVHSTIHNKTNQSKAKQNKCEFVS